MIANYTSAGWEIVSQRTHGLLAAQLATNWSLKERPVRWLETLLTIAEHDDAEDELDGETLLTDSGGPLNFFMKPFNLEHCKKLSRQTMLKSRYIAMIVSMHMDFLYRKEKTKHVEAGRFLRQQGQQRIKWMKALKISRSEAEKIYCMVEWFDACSLLICQGQLPPERRAVEISHGTDKVKFLLYQLNEKELTVDPWPFETEKFTVAFEVRNIKKIAFTNSSEFRRAFLKATVVEKQWTLVKAIAAIKPKMKRL